MQNRRKFFQTLLAGFAALGTMMFSPMARARKLGLKLNSVPDLKKVGGSAIVKLADKQILLIRTSKSQVVAMSPICTHQKCFVGYNAAKKRVDCGCHGSSFDMNGKVLFGPAPKSLSTYGAVLDGERIIVTVE